MAFTRDEIIKEGFMVKRSQNKKIYTPVNHKQRWFVLTRDMFIYYDCDTEGKRKERGRILLKNVQYIEAIQSPSNDNEKSLIFSFPFQVGYQESGQEYILYLYAPQEQDRQDWIILLRKECSGNKNLKTTYHKGFWNGRKWSCCKGNQKQSVLACCDCSSWTLATLGTLAEVEKPIPTVTGYIL